MTDTKTMGSRVAKAGTVNNNHNHSGDTFVLVFDGESWCFADEQGKDTLSSPSLSTSGRSPSFVKQGVVICQSVSVL